MSFAALIPADPVQNHTHLHPLLRWQGMGLQRDGHNQQYAKEEVSKVWGAMNLSLEDVSMGQLRRRIGNEADDAAMKLSQKRGEKQFW